MDQHGVNVTVHGLCKAFTSGKERLRIISGVDLTVKAGERVAITGESGSGKSTLLSLIAGLDIPDEGTIRVGEYHVEALSGAEITAYRSRGVGLVFQFHYLLQDFSALENVMLPALLASPPVGVRRCVTVRRSFCYRWG